MGLWAEDQGPLHRHLADLATLARYEPISRWTAVPVDAGPHVPDGARHMCRVKLAPAGSGRLPACPAHMTLDAAHARKLGGHEFGFHADEVIECNYVASHRPPHLGMGQPNHQDTDDDVDEPPMRWWWLLWTGAHQSGGLLHG